MLIKWWKRRKDVKKLKALKKELDEAMISLGTVRDETTLGELADRGPVECPICISDINLNQIIVQIGAVVAEMNEEIDDRTRERKPIFKKVQKVKNAL